MALANHNPYTRVMATKPLLKVLTEAGIDSRRRLADAIREGRVRVNGVAAENFRQPVDTAVDKVTINEKPVDLKPERLVYLMFNKPAGVVSTTRDERGRRTVIDFLPEKYRHLRLYPVGRLDRDTTGLLLLTNDGELTNRLTHPRYEREKEYLVAIKGKLKPDEKRKLEQGIELEDGLTHPSLIRETSDPLFNYSITLHEGKKRQVRRMFDSLGHPVQALKRVRLGSLRLGKLKEGEFRELSAQEVQALLK
jgi:23S rRNA pseudouridine2605 synthase